MGWEHRGRWVAHRRGLGAWKGMGLDGIEGAQTDGLGEHGRGWAAMEGASWEMGCPQTVCLEVSRRMGGDGIDGPPTDGVWNIEGDWRR